MKYLAILLSILLGAVYMLVVSNIETQHSLDSCKTELDNLEATYDAINKYSTTGDVTDVTDRLRKFNWLRQD